MIEGISHGRVRPRKPAEVAALLAGKLHGRDGVAVFRSALAVYGHAALVAEVERQARETELTALRAAQDAVQLREPDPWPGDPDVYELDEEWLDDEPR